MYLAVVTTWSRKSMNDNDLIIDFFVTLVILPTACQQTLPIHLHWGLAAKLASCPSQENKLLLFLWHSSKKINKMEQHCKFATAFLSDFKKMLCQTQNRKIFEMVWIKIVRLKFNTQAYSICTNLFTWMLSCHFTYYFPFLIFN